MTKITEMLSASRNNISTYNLNIKEAGMNTQLRDYPGVIRETFFLNQMRVNHDLFASPVADLQIDDKPFEVEGNYKGQKQIKEVENSYVIKDDIEYAFMGVIPLWQSWLTHE